MRENLKLGLILFIITALSGLSIGFVNDLTAETIAENKAISSSDLAELLPGATGKTVLEVPSGDESEKTKVEEAFEVQGDSEVLGHIIKVTTTGFHGNIEMFVAISKEDKLSGIKVIGHSETPGLGAKIVEEKFRSGFVSKPVEKGISIVKGQASAENEVDAISGATVSSRAVGTGVNTAISYYMKTIKGVDFELEETDGTSGASESDATSGASGSDAASGASEAASDGTSGASE
ncbi:RnfABCDGE type electron transport complex subunit G [Clostridium thermarum]|uniref:RnfABCDGE type electron transport complex subunit G n=1 Tax=Clostridium thermarum TaxID=1716543 RepID=UPI0011237131|nr:RnfABCDGE type electron transport complex subunit G [Clostridium thermarum]